MELEINARTLAPIHCASTDETRYNINSLHFAADGSTVATDGHILARVIPATTVPDTLEPFSLTLEQLDSLQREQKKRKAIPAQLDREETNANGHAKIRDFNGARELPKLDGNYPDWKNFYPTEEPAHTVGISLHNLEKLVASARQLTGTRKGDVVGVEFQIQKGELAPIVAKVEDLDQKDAKGNRVERSGDALEFVIMPCRIR